MNLDEINWDFNEAGNWPTAIKIGAIVLGKCYFARCLGLF